jgi:hypothetical protein
LPDLNIETVDKLFGLADCFARRVESVADEAGGFVVEIGFVAYELQNCRHVRPRFVRVQHVSSLAAHI